jgi:threonine dehydrogenase-like Zn-dependent dehydrogenase
MKRLVCTGVGKVGWAEFEHKPLASDQVRVRFQYGVEKHGTMMAFFKGYGNERGRWDNDARIHMPEGILWNYPIPLGNMQYGEVTEAGSSVTKVKVGDKVFVSAGFQPEATVSESDLRVLSPEVTWQSGMLLDPAEFALGAIRDGNVRLGDRVAVFGLGAIGLVTVQALRAAGATTIIAIDPLENRRTKAAKLGATNTLDPVGTDVGLTLRQLTNGLGPDVIIDFSGSPHALQSALRGVAYGGTIVCGAFPPPHTVGLDFGGEAHMNRPRIIFSRACSDPNPEHPRWDFARIQATTEVLINRGELRGEELVDEPIPFEDLLEAYPKIALNPHESVKLSVVYP